MIKLSNIEKIYQDKNQTFIALNGVDLTIEKEEIVIIVGESGSGKTTLLNIIGLINNEYKGDYILNNENSHSLSNQQKSMLRNQYFGYIFQNYQLVDSDSVYDNIEIPLLYSKKWKKSERKTKIIEVAQKMGIENHLYKKVTKLSGGERQRVAIARALVNEPEIVLMDEPTSALNRELSKVVMDLVYDYVKQNQKTLIIVTHDINRVINGSFRKIQMRDGKIISDTFEHQ